MSKTLLLVDDEPLLLKMLKLNLSDLVDEILTAGDGLEALEVLKNHKVDCIVCDVNMPRMNGVDLIKKVRELEYAQPFIFYTGHGNQELMLEVSKYGAFDFLNKPELSGLEEVVMRALKVPSGECEVMSSEELSDFQKMIADLADD